MKRFKHDLTLILGICCFLPAAAQWRMGAYIGTPRILCECAASRADIKRPAAIRDC